MTRLLTLLCFICVVALNVVADTKETVTIDGSAVDKFVSQLTFNGSDVVLVSSVQPILKINRAKTHCRKAFAIEARGISFDNIRALVDNDVHDISKPPT